jgi:hypothetical protein
MSVVLKISWFASEKFLWRIRFNLKFHFRKARSSDELTEVDQSNLDTLKKRGRAGSGVALLRAF